MRARIRIAPAAGLVATGALLAAAVAAPAPAAAQSSVYRCTAADGSIEFRQHPCARGDHSETLQIQDNRTGWQPPQPGSAPKPKGQKARKGATSTSPRKQHVERCWKKRQQIARINNELRAGYKPARGERLKRRRRELEAYLNEFCR